MMNSLASWCFAQNEWPLLICNSVQKLGPDHHLLVVPGVSKYSLLLLRVVCTPIARPPSACHFGWVARASRLLIADHALLPCGQLTCAPRYIPPAVRLLTKYCTLVWASGSVGDCVPLILASYQRPPHSPPVQGWFGTVPPNRPFSPFGLVAPRILLSDGPDWALVVKQFGKRFGWAPWVTTAPHPWPWSRANSAPPPVLALCPPTNSL